jgi:hypothetical protein
LRWRIPLDVRILKEAGGAAGAWRQRSSCRWGLWVLLVGELGSVELGVEAVLGQQAGVGAPLNDTTIVDDQ